MSYELVWIVQHVLSVCFRRIELRLKIISETNVDLHICEELNKYQTKNFHCVYLASFGRKGSKIAFWFDSVV